MSETKRLVGHIGVDAGLVHLGDPCYSMFKSVHDPDKHNQPFPDFGKNWHEFVDKLYEGNPDGQVKCFGHNGSLGISVQSGYGDGSYPVYVTYKGGRVASVTVEFIGDEDDSYDSEEDFEDDESDDEDVYEKMDDDIDK